MHALVARVLAKIPLAWENGGVRPRNTRGDAMVSWVLANGFNVCSRQTSQHPARESWTCQRMMDGARVQLDYILADGHVTVQQVWHDYILPICLDHRCAHCILQWCGARPPPKHRRTNLKNWVPKLDENGTATSFCNCLREQLKRIQEVFSQLYFVFLRLLFGRKKVQRYRAVLLGSLQAQTVFILASLQMGFW